MPIQKWTKVETSLAHSCLKLRWRKKLSLDLMGNAFNHEQPFHFFFFFAQMKFAISFHIPIPHFNYQLRLLVAVRKIMKKTCLKKKWHNGRSNSFLAR